MITHGQSNKSRRVIKNYFIVSQLINQRAPKALGKMANFIPGSSLLVEIIQLSSHC